MESDSLSQLSQAFWSIFLLELEVNELRGEVTVLRQCKDELRQKLATVESIARRDEADIREELQKELASGAILESTGERKATCGPKERPPMVPTPFHPKNIIPDTTAHNSSTQAAHPMASILCDSNGTFLRDQLLFPGMSGSYWATDTNPKEDTLPTRPKKRPRSGERASTPYSLESESLRMDCIMYGDASPPLAINTVTNKVALYKKEKEGSDSPRSSLNNSLSDQSLASVNLNSVGSVHSYTPVTPPRMKVITRGISC
ncbi:unnamed protein product [Coregonus sp. 'balchen']|nr:unnamed protein product [Coregonus sp. 'balchen']